MIQDIFPDKLYNQFDPAAQPAADSPVYIFNNKSLMISTADCFRLPVFSQLSDYLSEHAEAQVTYLFKVNDVKYFLLRTSDKENTEVFADRKISYLPGDFIFKKIFDIRWSRLCSRTEFYALITAYHLSAWYSKNIYCGHCAAKLVNSEKERALICPECGNTVYPRINPAVIVAVTDHDRLLMTKYRGRAEIPFYALIAGFVEIGETLEETVAREVMEETGIRVKNIHYYKSQPWGSAGDILSGYYCDADGSTDIRIEEDELAVAEWMDRKDVPGQPDDMSLTNEMMIVFRNGNEPQ